MGDDGSTVGQNNPPEANEAARLGSVLISRRRLLALVGAGTGGLVVVTRAEAGILGAPARLFNVIGNILDPLLPPARIAPSASILVARPDDGLFLTLTFANLEIVPHNLAPPQMALRDPTKPGYVMIGLPPQAVFEQAVFDQGSGVTPPTPPVPAEMSGPSRVVLLVAPGAAPFAYNLPTVLGMSAFPLSVSDVAESGSGASLPLAPPAPTETAIEAPWRLVLSPRRQAAFSTEVAPVTRSGRTELWHARAVLRRPDGQPDHRPVPVPIRAIWSPDLPVPNGTPLTGPGFPAADTATTGISLTPPQRADLVAATTTAAPAQSSLLLVSPMGASLDVLGAWPERNDVVFWRHRSWLARDNYVRVDKPGFLFPFGFKAVKVSITERVLGGGSAFLRKREFIVVREPTVLYQGAGPDQPDIGQPAGGRSLPFRSATTTTLVSPPLLAVREKIGKGEWVQIAGLPPGKPELRYQLVLTGHDGTTVTADLPAVFVPAGELKSQVATNPAYDPGDMGVIVGLYNSDPVARARRTLGLGGQKLGFVPRRIAAPGGPVPEDPALPTFDLVLRSALATKPAAELLAAFRMNGFPVMDAAQVVLEAVDAIGGTAATKQEIKLDAAYTGAGFGGAANAGEVWANLTSPPKLTVPQKTGGGLSAPALNVAGLSRAFGAVADPGKIATGVFDPKAYFDLSVNLLGGISLADVVLPASGLGSSSDEVPKVVTVRSATTLDTVVSWRPKLTDLANGLFVAGKGDDGRLDLKAVFHTDLANPGGATQTVTGDLRNFELNFVGNSGVLYFIKQKMKRLHFESRNGAKPTVDVVLGASSFEGQLKFLVELQRYLPALPGGITTDVTTAGVRAGLTIAIPSVAIGVVAIQNLSIGVILDLPFDGNQARLGFSFATREHPFAVTVSLFSGGGFLGIGLGTRGVQLIEGSLEFGAAIALDLVVASGSVSITAGIYFKFAQRLDPNGIPLTPAENTVVITGFVRAVGNVEVLGLINISIEFYLGLGFSTEGGGKKVQGVATLTVRVEVLMFSTSVSLTMRKEFSGGPDPFFGDQLTAGDWAGYCAAFAA